MRIRFSTGNDLRYQYPKSSLFKRLLYVSLSHMPLFTFEVHGHCKFKPAFTSVPELVVVLRFIDDSHKLNSQSLKTRLKKSLWQSIYQILSSRRGAIW